MQLIPIHAPILKKGDSIASLLKDFVRAGDIVAVSSKAVATVEGATVYLTMLTPSTEAMKWSDVCTRSPAFCEAVIHETKKWRGEIVGSCPGALLTELKPEGMKSGSILIANAGLDESNTPDHTAIGWPEDPVRSLTTLRNELKNMISSESSESSASSIGLLITDSSCMPRRIGVTAFALAVSGFNPLSSQVGQKDLYGKKLTITTEAVADQLATAANAVMGNAGQSIPAVIIRDHGISLNDFEGWVSGMSKEEDLFSGIL